MTWTPTWTPDEAVVLEGLQQRNSERDAALDKIFEKEAKPRKWNWPPEALEIVKKAQDDKANVEELLTRDLVKLYTWPSEELARDDVLIEGKGAFVTFNRKRTWIEDLGFYKFQTDYTFSDNWDKERMVVTFFVPKGLPAGYKAPVMWFFHGGGFCTGAGDFPAWYSQTSVQKAIDKKAIIIAPDYPLGPEGNYKDIVDSIQDFLNWYKEEGSLEPRSESWTQWLYNQEPKQDFIIDKDHVYIEGESAGGHAAVTAMWLNATKGGTNLPIDVALLRYPMIAHYARNWDECAKATKQDGKVDFMGSLFTKEEVKSRKEDIEKVINELEDRGLVPTCSSRWPAVGMAFAFVLSVTERWQWFFQRRHKLADPKKQKESDYMDGIERVEHTHAEVEHDLLPPIYIIHGDEDKNCPPKNTKRFVETLRKTYPTRYKDDKTLRLDIVDMISKKPHSDEGRPMVLNNAKEVGHAFDYSLDEKNEKFLRDAYDWIGAYWKPSKSDSLSSSLKD